MFVYIYMAKLIAFYLWLYSIVYTVNVYTVCFGWLYSSRRMLTSIFRLQKKFLWMKEIIFET